MYKVFAKKQPSQPNRMWCCDQAGCTGHPTPWMYREMPGFEGFEFSPNFSYHWTPINEFNI